MARRKLLTASARQSLFEIPTDTVSLEKHYAFGSDDLELITSRRSNANRFGLALHLALLRHPGQGWHDEEDLPEQLLDWIGQQLALPHSLISEYGSRPATRSSHRALAMAHLNLRPFSSEPFSQVLDIASRAAFDTDDGRIIMERLIDAIRAQDLVLPGTDTLERIGIAGRARAEYISKRGTGKTGALRSRLPKVASRLAACHAPLQ